MKKQKSFFIRFLWLLVVASLSLSLVSCATGSNETQSTTHVRVAEDAGDENFSLAASYFYAKEIEKYEPKNMRYSVLLDQTSYENGFALLYLVTSNFVDEFQEEKKALLELSLDVEGEENPWDTGRYYGEESYHVVYYDMLGKIEDVFVFGYGQDEYIYSVLDIKAKADGQISLIIATYSNCSLYTIDKDRKEISSSAFLQPNDSGMYAFTAEMDDAGRIYLMGDTSKTSYVSVYNASGYEISTVELYQNHYEDNSSDFFAGKIFSSGDKVYATGATIENYEEEYWMCEVNPFSYDLGEKIPVAMPPIIYQIESGNPAAYIAEDGLYPFSASKGISDPVLLWKDVDFDLGQFPYSSYFISEDTILIHVGVENGSRSYILEKSGRNLNADKTILKVGAFIPGAVEDLNRMVYEFNQYSKEYRIEIENYGDFWGYGEDYTMILQTLREEQRNGTLPDAFYFNENNLSFYSELLKNNLLTDLYEFMDTDGEYSRTNFHEKILADMEQDGALYGIPHAYTILSLGGDEKFIEERNGWTFDEFSIFSAGFSSSMGTRVGYSYSAGGYLDYALITSLSHFWRFGEIREPFPADDLLDILEFCLNFAEQGDVSGEEVLTTIYYPSISIYQDYWEGNGSPSSYTGFPSFDRSGPICQPKNLLAISNTSSYKEEAWDFVKLFLSMEEQDLLSKRISGGFPIRNSSLEVGIQSAMAPPTEHGYSRLSREGEQTLRSLIGKIDKVFITNYVVFQTIIEDASLLFYQEEDAFYTIKLIEEHLRELS